MSEAPPPRRRRAARVLLALSLTIAALLLVAGAFLYYALHTESGLRFALAQVQRFTADAVQVGKADGRLLGELNLSDLSYTGSDGTRVTIGHLRLRLAPRALLAWTLHVELLEVDRLVVTPGAARPQPENAPPTQLPVRLPLDVVFDAVKLTGFELRTGPEAQAPTYEVESAEFVGQWTGDTIEVKQLAAGLTMTGRLLLSAKLRMFTDRVDVEQFLLQGPGEISAKGTLGVGEVRSDFALQWQQLHWPLVLEDKTPATAGDIHGGLKVSGTPKHYDFKLDTNATLQGRAAQLAAQGSGSLQGLQIDRLQLDTLAGDGSDAKTAGLRGAISARGQFDWSPQLRAELQAQLTHVDPSLFVNGVPGDINGKLVTTTTTADGHANIVFSADITRSTLRGQPFTLAAEGSTDTRRAQLKNFLLQAGAGRVQAQGEVAWTPRLAANIDAQIARLNPALFAADWPGEINGTVMARTAKTPDAAIAFDAKIDKSTLRGYPLTLDVQGAVKAETVTLTEIKLASGTTRLSAAGQVTPPFDVSGKFDSPDLAALYPKLKGRAAFDFKLAGTIERPHLLTKGEATALAYDVQKVGRLNWEADVDPQMESKIDIAAADADVGFAIRSIKLKATGLEVYHRVELNLDSERGAASLALQGGFDRKRGEWGGELAALALKPVDMPAWSLEKPAGILIGQQRRALEPTCLKGEGRACVTLEQNVLKNGTRLGWNIDHLLLTVFQPLLPPEYRLGGIVDGEGTLNFTGGDIADAIASLSLHDARMDTPDAPPLILQTGTLRADQTAGRLHGVVELRTEQGLIAADVAAAPGAGFSERALSGQIKVDVPNLAFLEPLLPQLQALAGKLAGVFELGGTPAQPRLGGQLALSDGQAKLVIAGIELKDVQVKVVGNGSGPLTLNGALRSGDGTMTLSGNVNPFASPMLADIQVKGDKFQAMNTVQARAWVSPDLHLVRDAKGATLTGTLTVPQADISPKGFGGGGVSVSSDQVLVGAEAQPPPAALPVFVTLRLVLGDAVRIEGYGLKTRIVGDVTVTQEPQREARGRGELRLVDGRYKAYGQDLNIETGRLLFTDGPVTVPALDLYATRKPREDITVGVRVRGTLAKPELTLASTPTLPREQQLSWLILGRSLETSSTEDRSLVSSAALSLGLGGGDYVTNLIGKRIGLDQFSVGGATGGGSEVAASAQSISGAQYAGSATDAGAQAAQLTLGKYLTPRLFVSYGISLFQQGYSFRLLYTLGRGFKLSTESGSASGGDLIYSFERGKKKKKPPPVSAQPQP